MVSGGRGGEFGRCIVQELQKQGGAENGRAEVDHN